MPLRGRGAERTRDIPGAHPKNPGGPDEPRDPRADARQLVASLLPMGRARLRIHVAATGPFGWLYVLAMAPTLTFPILLGAVPWFLVRNWEHGASLALGALGVVAGLPVTAYLLGKVDAVAVPHFLATHCNDGLLPRCFECGRRRAAEGRTCVRCGNDLTTRAEE